MSETKKTSAEELLHPILQHTIGDGDHNIIIDLENSHDVWMMDKLSDRKYLDFFSFFASAPLGYNHPAMLDDIDFLDDLRIASLNKISNSDYYTPQLSEFVKTFAEKAAPKNFNHLFFISGGALAVENALKASFDWKVRTNFAKGYTNEQGSQVLHFKEAFHGRSGYTLSLTNTTDPRKYQYFPRFSWPRVSNPKITFPLDSHLDEVKALEEKSLTEINQAFEDNKDDIAAIIIEPIQGEGGDNHFRPEFLKKLRQIADEQETMLVFDEVQTGVGLTGKMWAFQHFQGAEPDIIAFGKKTQVCGIMANDRIDSIENNVFKESSRINSTWGGNLTDMVRSRKILDIITEEKLVHNADEMGNYLAKALFDLQEIYATISNVRNRGLFAAFDMNTQEERDSLLKALKKNGLILLKSGIKSIRFRPPLIIQKEHIDTMYNIVDETLKHQY